MTWARTWAGVAGVLAMASVPAAGRMERADLAELEAKVGTMYVVSQLHLSAAQRKELLRLRQEVAPMADKLLARLRDWRKSTGKAVRDFVQFSSRTGRFPPEDIQQGLIAFDHPLIGMPREFRLAAAPVVDELSALLTPRQADFLAQVCHEKWRVVGAEYVFQGCSKEDETDPKLNEGQRKAALADRIKAGSFTRGGHLCIAPYMGEALGLEQDGFAHWWDMGIAITRETRVATSHGLTFLLGLHLEPDQMVAVSRCLRRKLPETGHVGQYAEDLGTKEGKAYLRQLVRAARTLARNKKFDKEDMAALVQARCLWQDTQGKARSGEKGRLDRQKATEQICDAVIGTLTEAQQTRMLTMRACAIPNADVKSTTRAGQVTETRLAAIAEIIDTARARRDWGSEQCKGWWDARMTRLVGGTMWLEQMTDEERRQAYARAKGAVERARAMDDARYVAERQTLCRGLLDLDLAAAAIMEEQRQLAQDGRRDEMLRDKVRAYFVYGGARMLYLIDQRLANLAPDARRSR